TDISISRTQTGLAGAMPIPRASSAGAPCAYSRSTRRCTLPSLRKPAVSAPGRISQYLWAGDSEGGTAGSQPGAKGAKAFMALIMPRAGMAHGPCREIIWGCAHGDNAIYGKSANFKVDGRAGHVFPPRGRQLHRARLGQG